MGTACLLGACSTATASSPLRSTTQPLRIDRTIHATVVSGSRAPLADSPLSVDPLTSHRVYALVQQGDTSLVLMTQNGGQSWSTQGTVPLTQTGSLHFINPTEGFAWGQSSLWSTNNGGKSWHSVNRQGLTGINFTSPRDGMAILNGVVVQTHDAGIHWSTSLAIPHGTFRSASMINAQDAYAAATLKTGPSLYRTLDGGRTWSPVFAGVTSPALVHAYHTYLHAQIPSSIPRPRFTVNSQVTFTTPTVGWLTLFSGSLLSTAVFHTIDGGESWTYVWGNGGCLMSCNAMGEGLYPATYLGPNNVWRYDLQGIDHSTNAGKSWTRGTALPFNMGSNEAVRQTAFISPSNGWIAALGGIYVTHDGGRQWFRQWPAQPQGASLVAFTSRGYGWLVTSSTPSQIWTTTNGGRTWNVLSKNFGDIASVDLWGPNQGLVATFPSPNWITHNGMTWTRTPLPARFQSGADQAYGIDYVNPQDGWFDSFEELWATHNAGKTWHAIHSLQAGPFLGDFLTAKIGWALEGHKYGSPKNMHDRVITTINGGKTWRSAGTVPLMGTSSISFVTPHTGYVVTAKGVLATRDAGIHWSRIIIANAHPTSVSAADNALYVITVQGRVLKSTDGGRQWTTLIPG